MATIKTSLLAVHVTPETETEILNLRKQDKFVRWSKAEIVRYLINKGLEAAEKEAAQK